LKIEIKRTSSNPLIGRREISFEIIEGSTPSRSEVRRELAVQLRSDLETIYVRNLDTKTGTNVTVGLAHVYDDLGRALEVEPEHIVKRNQIKEKESEE
jgi:ribosomal protein S24E